MATIDEMMAKNEKDFRHIELEVILKNIMTAEEKGKITLVFYSPDVKSEYRKNYLIDDVKGRVDFNRAMFSLGCTKKNFGAWLDRMMRLEILTKISLTDRGFIRFIKVLDKDKKEKIAKSLFLDGIEGLDDEDRAFLMGMSLKLLKKEFGQ
jgi:hypothetical protein